MKTDYSKILQVICWVRGGHDTRPGKDGYEYCHRCGKTWETASFTPANRQAVEDDYYVRPLRKVEPPEEWPDPK